MTWYWALRRWFILLLLRVAYSWRRHRQSRKLIRFLSLFFPFDRNWTQADERGTWVSENIGRAKKEGISDCIHTSDVIILWIPGGGFRFDLSPLYMNTLITLIKALEADKNLKCTMLVANYRKSPEYQFPAAVDDLKSTYQWLTDVMQVPREKLVIGADDAGAALAIDLMYLHNTPFAGAVFSSPYTGLEAGGESWRANGDVDYVTAAAIERMEESYIPSEGEQPFRYLPSQVNMATCLPRKMLVIVGGNEVLLDEAGYLASRARDGGVQVTLLQSPDQIHLWSMLGPVVVDDRKALQNAIDHTVQFVADVVVAKKL